MVRGVVIPAKAGIQAVPMAGNPTYERAEPAAGKDAVIPAKAGIQLSVGVAA